jgi:asparagine synthase (glutamine-hydrolysing)
MQGASSTWGHDRESTWIGTHAALGRSLRYDTPEDLYDTLPILDDAREIAFTAEGRLDNRDELCEALNVPSGARSEIADAELMRRAYLAWGDSSPDRLLGDWSFAAWHPHDRRLILARDHYGNTSLHYAATADRFAFASSIRALLALPWVDRSLNEAKFAGSLVFWKTYDTETFFNGVAALPPAHTAIVTAEGARTHRYWRLEDTPELVLGSDREYVDALLASFGQSVRSRLRAIRGVGATLSSGLDSASVTALAARELKAAGRRLAAYTWVPAYEQETPGRDRITDEGSGAEEVSRMAGNVDLHRIRGNVDPVAAIRRAVECQTAPVVNPGNAAWLDETYRTAVEQGVTSVLTGAMGNATVSWAGLQPQHWWHDIRQLGWTTGLRTRFVRPLVPQWALGSYRRLRYGDPYWPLRYAPVGRSLADRLHLERRLTEDRDYLAQFQIPSDPRQARTQLIRPADWPVGAWEAAFEAYHGLSLRPATVDKRVMQLCFSIPDRVYSGADRQGRWLIREATRGLLPDSVRLSPHRGSQAADLVMRLRAHGSSVEDALAEAERSPLSRELLDVPKMRAAWHTIRTQRGNESWTLAIFCLLLGLQAAIFLQSENSRCVSRPSGEQNG